MDRRGKRASSALGRLETSHVNSILDASTILGELKAHGDQNCPDRPGSPDGLAPLEPAPPAWFLKIYLTGQRTRSHSVGPTDLIQGRTPPCRLDLMWSQKAQKVEHQVTLEELLDLNTLFQEYERRGHQLLDMETFKGLMQQCLRSQKKNTEQIEQLFKKIDYTAAGRIRWDTFCTYLQLEYSGQAEALARHKEVSFLLPAELRGLSYGGPVLRVLAMPDDTLIMMREDGAIYFWSLQLRLKRKKRVFEKPISRKPRWVTDVASMPQYNKLIVGTGSRELQLYEISNLEPYCQISGLETLPLRLVYHYMDPDKCLILYGDDQGCVNILALASVGELLRTWKKLPRVENMPNISVRNMTASPNVSYNRWKVHGDWVTQLSYYDSINAVISSSNHEPTAVVIGCAAGTTSVKQKVKGKREGSGNVPAGRDRACPTVPQRRADGDQTVFRIHRGVRAFTFCKKSNLLLTGGMDRIIRIWNPYLPGKPTGLLKGHAAPVLYTHVTAEDSRIFSTSADSTVKIWDLETHSCLFTACSKASGIHGEPTACLYLPRPRALCVVTDTVALLHLRPRPSQEPHRVLSHREPVVCCCYNPAFRHVASCSEASVIRVWDLGSGRLSSEFVGTHGDAGVTCLTFDTSGRRLVTGGRDGCLKIWSYNNGHCLHTLSHDENSSEVCDCTYLEVNQSRFIIAVGWDRRINVYFDIPHDFHHFWKPQPHWLDDLNHGHKEDILCVAQCPPALLATSSYDGEIIVWNVTSGHIYCKLNTPVPSGDPVDPERGVSCLAFLKTRAAKFESASASLMANGPQGSITFWKLFGGACVIADFTPSRRKAQVSSIVVTADDALAYLADQEGFVHVYDIKEYGLQGPEPRPPRAVKVWRAHISTVTSLELIEEDKALLSSSLDCSVRLWSMEGEHIGSFGQSSPWDISIPASWNHPRVPCDVLRDPQSMPSHPALEGQAPALSTGHGDHDKTASKPSTKLEETSVLPFPGGPILEAEIKEEVNQWLQRTQGPAPQRSTEPVWPSIHQTLRCQEIAHVPAFGERPDLSVIGSDRFSASTPPGKKVSLEPPSGTTDHRAGSSLSELQGNQATLLLARPASLWTPKA